MDGIIERYFRMEIELNKKRHEFGPVEPVPEKPIDDNEFMVFVCVDASEHAFRAFKWYSRNYYRKHHVIGIVHVFSLPDKHPTINYTTRMYDVKHDSSQLVQRYSDACKHNGMKVKTFSYSKTESIGRTICELIKENKPQSVVMGQRGLGPVHRTLFGSVSDFLLHHAHVPVLVVPPSKKAVDED